MSGKNTKSQVQKALIIRRQKQEKKEKKIKLRKAKTTEYVNTNEHAGTEIEMNLLSPGGSFMVQNMALTSSIPVFYGLKD